MKLSRLILSIVWSCLLPRILSDDRVDSFCATPNGNETIQGKSVPDCNCKFHSVDYAVKHFISPILRNLTTKTFFRYFKVDLESPCPYWPAVGQCSMEGCSVCPCEEGEIPKPWLESESKRAKKSDYGWIASSGSEYGFEGEGRDDSLGRISAAEGESAQLKLDEMYNDSQLRDLDVMKMNTGAVYGIQTDPEEDMDDSDDWTILDGSGKKYVAPHAQNLPAFAAAYGYNALFDPVETAEEVVVDASYVNLLENPEKFTGYSGPSAQRVWKSIQEENCFGEQNDVCLEKRVFYRLMSGLQSSISTHIARNYLHPDGKWGTNHPLYWRAVGAHPDRLNNMYFAFLFLLRAVVRAQEPLRSYAYNTGHSQDDLVVSQLLNKLLESSAAQSAQDQHFHSHVKASPAESHLKELLRGTGESFDVDAMAAVEECRYGFNESELFQVPEAQRGPQYWNTLQDKQELRDEFMIKFRNISRIMDCVTCDKCRVWGKLQVLGIGTAIKILLHPADQIVTSTATVSTKNANTDRSVGADSNTADAGGPTAADAATATCDVLDTKQRPKLTLNRQEIIALLNTLNQFSNSLIFAADAAELAGRADIPEQPVQFGQVGGGVAGDATAAALGREPASQFSLWVKWLTQYTPSVMSVVAIAIVMRKKMKTMKEKAVANRNR